MRTLSKQKPKLISLILTVALLATAVNAQQKAREKGPGAGESARKAEDTQRKLEDAQRQTQAIDILKSVVESAAEIEDMQTRVAILTDALYLLWKHDEPYARSTFIKTATTWSDKFVADTTEKQERFEIRVAMSTLLASFARHDAPAATRLLDKFQKLLEDVSKGSSVTIEERLSIARASLESNTAESTALAARALENGVSSSFPLYLIELERHNPSAAKSLFRLAISILSAGRVYNTRDVTILSAYVFRESQVSIPVPSGGFGGAALVFGFLMLSPLSPPTKEMNQSLVTAYLNASGRYLNAEAIGLEQRTDIDPNHVGRCFFLVKKMRAYANRLGLDGGQNWALLDAKYTMLAERAKITERALTDLAEVAQRIVTKNTAARFDAGETAFAAAEKENDPAQHDELLVTGISQQMDEGKYAEALQKIAQVRDDKTREQLNTRLAFRLAQSSLKKLDWDGFNAQLNRVTDARLHIYLVLSAALSASDARKKKMSSDFLLTALSTFPKIEDLDVRAAAIVATAGILYATTDESWSAQVLTDGVNAINRTSGKYHGDVFGVLLGTSESWMWIPLAKFDLSQCFEQAAKRDWPGAVAAAQSIQSKELRSQAYIAASRSVL